GQRAVELAHGGVDVRQGQANERVEAARVPAAQVQVQVVRAARHHARSVFARVIRRRLAERDDHAVDAGGIHQLELALDRDVGGEAADGADQTAALDAGDLLHEVVQRGRMVVGVYVDTHQRLEIRARPATYRRPSWRAARSI